MNENLYEISKAITSILGSRFVKVEVHDSGDPESFDLLWLESTPDDAFTEGEVLSIGPAIPNQSVWYAAIDSAHRFGGWATNWSVTGSTEEVITAVLHTQIRVT